MATKQTMEVIDSFGPTLDLPFIVSTGPRVHRHDNGSTIFMTPSYIPAIVDYIIFNEWNRVYYMYDSNEGMFSAHFSMLIALSNLCTCISKIKFTFLSTCSTFELLNLSNLTSIE